MKEQHDGRNILSLERKVATIDINQGKEKQKTVQGGTVTITRQEIENLQDILQQTVKDEEEVASYWTLG